MMNQKSAVWYLANATRTCPIPLNPEGFRRKDRAPHDFVFFGHTPVRTYKRAGQWQFLDADVRRAGRRMAELPWDSEDLADLWRDEQGESEPAAFVHTSWWLRSLLAAAFVCEFGRCLVCRRVRNVHKN
ncbi:hypothetical protein [Streptomyces sp. NPDC058268]|uniref:hypothetical protein n=1 Tax=Streptomyces sp. NPDC058268 TaxID=3346413 RepID=UPI0036E69DB8